MTPSILHCVSLEVTATFRDVVELVRHYVGPSAKFELDEPPELCDDPGVCIVRLAEVMSDPFERVPKGEPRTFVVELSVEGCITVRADDHDAFTRGVVDGFVALLEESWCKRWPVEEQSENPLEVA